MTTQVISASYNDAISVNFTSDAWFNATAVGNHFDKDARFWLNRRDTVEYISALADSLNNSICDFLQQFSKITELDGESAASRAKLLKLAKQTGLVRTKPGSIENGGGSWFHPKLAIAFARWLDVRFSIWCDMQIEKILHPAQYGLKQLPSLPLKKTQKALPGCLTVETQDDIKQLINDRAAELPREKQAGFVISMWSALGNHFGIKKAEGDKTPAYKHIPEGARLECLSLIARLSVDDLVTMTRDEFNQLKALPAPEAKTGEVLPKQQHDRITLELTPLIDEKPRYLLITQMRDKLTTINTLADDEQVMTIDKAIKELKHKNYVVFDRTGVSVRKMVLDYIPAQFLPEMIEAAAQRLQAIERGKLAS